MFYLNLERPHYLKLQFLYGQYKGKLSPRESQLLIFLHKECECETQQLSFSQQLQREFDKVIGCLPEGERGGLGVGWVGDTFGSAHDI